MNVLLLPSPCWLTLLFGPNGMWEALGDLSRGSKVKHRRHSDGTTLPKFSIGTMPEGHG
jgi:hypothetical protein